MHKLKKEIGIESIWVAIPATLAILTIGLLFGFDGWSSEPIEIQLHDTYLIISKGRVFTVLFANLTFWFFLCRQVKLKFENPVSNVILLGATGLLVFVTTLTIGFIGAMNQGWVIYPPLSAMPNGVPETHSATSIINSFVQAYQIFLIIALGFIGVKTGQRIGR
jgi:hypothetical protein